MAGAKVSFLVIGAQKAGTTALDHYLRRHPDVGMANVKEVHYFDDEDRFCSMPGDHTAYEACFPDDRPVCGEVTPIYLYWRPCCERIHRYNPAMKLIAVLRDPVDRAYSQWNMEFNRGFEHRQFATAIEEERLELRADPTYQHRVFSYLARGFYAEQIERLLRHFDQDQLLCVKYEDLRQDPQAVLDRIFDHIGVPPHAATAAPVVMNPGAYATPLPADLRSELGSIYFEHTKRCEELTGLNLSAWTSSSGKRS